MAITHHNVSRDTSNGYERLSKGGAVKTEFVGCILAVEDWRGAEPHWDSGWSADTGVLCHVFNGRTWSIVCPDGLRSDMRRDTCFTCEVDADHETRRAVAQWRSVLSWFARIREQGAEKAAALKAHNEIKVGKRVLVIKGRKVARGTTWYVASAGSGNYGPYVHLSSERNGMGEYVKYVNPDNLEVSEPFTYDVNHWEGCPFGAQDAILLSLAHKWNALPRGVYGRWDEVAKDETHTLALIADRLEEMGEALAACVRNAADAVRPTQCQYS